MVRFSARWTNPPPRPPRRLRRYRASPRPRNRLSARWLRAGRKLGLSPMSFRALLVTKDDQAAETLTPVLSNFGLRTECCGYSDAVCLITEQKFQAVLVDYDDPPSAALILQNLASTPFQTSVVTVALLSDKN